MQACILDSFVGQKEVQMNGKTLTLPDMDSDNHILERDRLWADQNNVRLHPSITVNNITYTGS